MANNSVVTQEVLQNTLENYHENFVYPYQNGATHTGFTPVGTVISYFGETAPEYFLICDGTEYAKSDYPQLADLLLNLTDPTPYEGSDSDHFKVPDLRGEFLRGTGTNGHTGQGSGANVGVHQNGSESPTLGTWSNNMALIQMKYPTGSETSNFPRYQDSWISEGSDYAYVSFNGQYNHQTIANRARFTSRPTNTSVLYCIAYKNIYIDLALDSFPLSISNPTDGQALVWNGTEGRWKNAGILHEYSTDEHVVGKWIDGKPVYEIVIVPTVDYPLIPANTWTVLMSISIPIDTLVDGYMISSDKSIPSKMTYLTLSYDTTNNNIRGLHSRNIELGISIGSQIVLQYTKTTDTV